MSGGWLFVTITSIVVVVAWTGLQIYSLFNTEVVVTPTVTPIEAEINTEIIDYLRTNSELVLINGDDLQPN